MDPLDMKIPVFSLMHIKEIPIKSTTPICNTTSWFCSLYATEFDTCGLVLKMRVVPFYTILCCLEPGLQPSNSVSIVSRALGQGNGLYNPWNPPGLFSVIATHMHLGGITDLQLHGTLLTNSSLDASFLDAKPSSVLSPCLQLSSSP